MYEILYLKEDGQVIGVEVKASNSSEALRKGDKEMIENGYDINDYTTNKVYCLK